MFCHIIAVIVLSARVAACWSSPDVGAIDTQQITVGSGDVKLCQVRFFSELEVGTSEEEVVIRLSCPVEPDPLGVPTVRG